MSQRRKKVFFILKPQKYFNLVITDFEMGLMLAIKQVYTKTRLQGCYFHLCQVSFKMALNHFNKIIKGCTEKIQTIGNH